MEDVKEPQSGNNNYLPKNGFNPCFNGRCKRTFSSVFSAQKAKGSFNPCFNGRCKRTNYSKPRINRLRSVSILVLMEDVKEPEKEKTSGRNTY